MLDTQHSVLGIFYRVPPWARKVFQVPHGSAALVNGTFSLQELYTLVVL